MHVLPSNGDVGRAVLSWAHRSVSGAEVCFPKVAQTLHLIRLFLLGVFSVKLTCSPLNFIFLFSISPLPPSLIEARGSAPQKSPVCSCTRERRRYSVGDAGCVVNSEACLIVYGRLETADFKYLISERQRRTFRLCVYDAVHSGPGIRAGGRSVRRRLVVTVNSFIFKSQLELSVTYTDKVRTVVLLRGASQDYSGSLFKLLNVLLHCAANKIKLHYVTYPIWMHSKCPCSSRLWWPITLPEVFPVCTSHK